MQIFVINLCFFPISCYLGNHVCSFYISIVTVAAMVVTQTGRHIFMSVFSLNDNSCSLLPLYRCNNSDCILGKWEKQRVPYVNRKTETFQNFLWQLFQILPHALRLQVPEFPATIGSKVCKFA